MPTEQLNLIYFLLVALFIWLIILTFITLKSRAHYKKLTRGANNTDLGKVLEEIIENQKSDRNHIAQILESLVKTQKKDIDHLQKYALVRYNPFEDAGGDQSFAAAFLDGQDTGIVISSLHSRSGTRVYAKSVVAGKASAHAFTKEEKEAVDKAARVGKIKKD